MFKIQINVYVVIGKLNFGLQFYYSSSIFRYSNANKIITERLQKNYSIFNKYNCLCNANFSKFSKSYSIYGYFFSADHSSEYTGKIDRLLYGTSVQHFSSVKISLFFQNPGCDYAHFRLGFTSK